MGSTARLAEEFHSHFTEYEKFDGHAEVSVRLMRRELPQNHWVGYEGLGFDVCETRLRSLTVALPDDKTRGKSCTKHAKYGFYSFNLPECVDECLDSKGRVRERTERVLVRAFNDKVLPISNELMRKTGMSLRHGQPRSPSVLHWLVHTYYQVCLTFLRQCPGVPLWHLGCFGVRVFSVAYIYISDGAAAAVALGADPPEFRPVFWLCT